VFGGAPGPRNLNQPPRRAKRVGYLYSPPPGAVIFCAKIGNFSSYAGGVTQIEPLGDQMLDLL